LASFFGRLFGFGSSKDEERQALAAEAAGDYLTAAKHFALAGNAAKVAEMHLLRAERSTLVSDEIAALRDALRWAPEGSPVKTSASRLLGAVLLARVEREGLATEKDRADVREAARLLEAAGDLGEAGSAWERAGDDDAAAKSYERAGLLDRMEQVLAREEKRARTGRRLREAFEEHELHLYGGDRESARSALRRCVDLADDKGEYRRLLDDLEARRLADGRVTLARRPGGERIIAIGRGVCGLGRDAGADVVLRTGGVSRSHAEIVSDERGFRVRDAGSRNGTLLAGLPVIGEVALDGAGTLGLGDECQVGFSPAGPGVLRLELLRGLDKGLMVLVLAADARADLHPGCGLGAHLWFVDGRPMLEADGGAPLRLNGHRIGRGPVQLIRRDVVALGDREVEVV
jgi:tetratricopeptide (TPR) repeat protein